MPDYDNKGDSITYYHLYHSINAQKCHNRYPCLLKKVVPEEYKGTLQYPLLDFLLWFQDWLKDQIKFSLLHKSILISIRHEPKNLKGEDRGKNQDREDSQLKPDF